VIPLEEYAIFIELPSYVPAATTKYPLEDIAWTPFTPSKNAVVADAEVVQVIPSYEYAIVLLPPPLSVPPATQREPVHVIHLQYVNNEDPDDELVQFIPSDEYAIAPAPDKIPTATHKDPLVAIAKQYVNNAVADVDRVQLIPSEEYAITPAGPASFPPASHKIPL